MAERAARDPQRIALIGYGAMGGHVHRALEGDEQLRITHVIVPPGDVGATQARLNGGAIAAGGIDGLDTQVDFALECAGHQAVSGTVPRLQCAAWTSSSPPSAR